MTAFLGWVLKLFFDLCLFSGVRVDCYMTPIAESGFEQRRRLGVKFSKNKKSYGVVAVLAGTDVATLIRTERPY